MSAPISCGKCGSRIPAGNEGPCPVCEDSPFGKPTYADLEGVDVPAISAYYLKELLAVIHGDGGHYTERRGLEKSVADAILKVSALQNVWREVSPGFHGVREIDPMMEADRLERLGRACARVNQVESLIETFPAPDWDVG